ncbi:hypothetical protein ACUY3K_03090 [Corynebacterium uberis]|uniref:hypothetical protein n=1 Tax=Corynebacterium TaxID=1716 RepID=UPI001D0B3C82|nr:MULTISPECIES: hypothetical protein [Corynebacterium]MCZ9309700.1 hypothetical protein [Corynebacterium sp. c6VSa_13]UDL73504.1 hypothetical protein LH391_10565 [Corynebacterium uberis]UDL75616.1 hypothetical protein LH393_10360 [Corynebacterium uberis]UDL77829.1 hypothetical protein LH394_10345 [Corynebacterium uberis]UDL80112.1 hypothetical protein LH392_10765 [Corynebacterium uberis]
MKSKPRTFTVLLIWAIVLLNSSLSFFIEIGLHSDGVAHMRAPVQVVALREGTAPDLLQELEHLSETKDELIQALRYEGDHYTTYVSRGGVGQEWLENGYPSPPMAPPVAVKPLDQLEGDGQGNTFWSSSPAMGKEIRNLANELGYETRDLDDDYFTFSFARWIKGIVACLSLVAFLSFAGALLQSREQAIQRLHGRSLVGAGLRTVLLQWRHVLTAIAVSVGLSIVAICSLLDRTLWSDYLSFWFAYLWCFLAVAVLAWLLGLGALSYTPLVSALKGKLTIAPVIACLLLIFSVTAISAFSVVSFAGVLYQDVHRREVEEPLWEGRAQPVMIQVTGATTEAHYDSIDHALNSTLASLARTGGVMTMRKSYNDLDSGSAVNSQTAYTVNYSAARTALIHGQDMHLRPDDCVLIGRADVHNFQEISHYIDQQGCRTLPDLSTELFTYGMSGGALGSSLVQKPGLVLVIPDGESVQRGPGDNLAALTQQEILFSQDRDVEKFMSDPQLRGLVAERRSAYERWHAEGLRLRQQLISDGLSAVLAVLVYVGVLLAGVVTVMVAFHQRLVVQYLLGHSLRSRLALFLPIVVAMVLTSGGWILWRQWRLSQLAKNQFVDPDLFGELALTPLSLVIICAVNLLAVCIGMAVLPRMITPRTVTQP